MNYIVGDIHGCYDLLMDGLKDISFDKEKDHLYSVGDLIDRGDKSIECLELVNEDWFSPVLGNHEHMMIEGIENGYDSQEFGLWVYNGGAWLNEYKDDSAMVDYILGLGKKIPLHITVDDKYGICHAQPPCADWDLVREDGLKEVHKSAMIWGRNWIEQEYDFGVKNIEKTFHGHTPMDKPLTLGNVNFIDTGAVFSNGELTIMELK